jgi:branched-chain amino acid transport system substrate-binding protein
MSEREAERERDAPMVGNRPPVHREFGAISRRGFLGGLGAGAATLSLGGVLAACGDTAREEEAEGGGTGNGGGTIRLGYVTPRTGPLAPFGEADDFVLAQMRDRLADGIEIGGATYAIEIIDRDTQSTSDQAAAVAQELIVDDGVNLMLVSSTPDTTNPVADQCEANGVPCISTVAPWQPYYIGRGGDPASGEAAFEFTYHFFWGLEDVIAVFLSMWNQIETNQIVGGLFPNDPDGNAWGDPTVGFPSPLAAEGYTIVDPGRYTNGTSDFSAQISAFRTAGAQLLTGVPIPPDFTTFWTQAAQQGFRPLGASIGKALLFPSAVEALGDLGAGLSTEVWWSPAHPFTSSITDQSAQELADAYTEETSQQWTQPIGFAHALFEVAVDVLTRSEDPSDPAAVVGALRSTSLETIVGTVDWSSGPVPNVAKTSLVGGQWRPGTEFPYDLVIVGNDALPEVPAESSLEPIAS